MQVNTDTQIARLIRGALKLQDRFAQRIPEEKRRLGEGRLGKVEVRDWTEDEPIGPNYTVMYFRVKNGLLEEILNPPTGEVRNKIVFEGIEKSKPPYTGVHLLLDCAKQKRMLRQAYSEGWFTVSAELREAIASYDSEEMMQMAEDMLDLIGDFLKRRSRSP
jgi:hypothetical protein